MRAKICILSVFLTLLSMSIYAQQYGYVTLIARQNANSVSLIDTNSTVVKQWTNLSGNTGYSTYMTKGGDLWRTVLATTSFMGGGVCGRLQKVSWDGTILFDYQVNTTNECSHHDICPLPNGNVLVIAYEKKTAAEVQAAGCSTNAIRWSEKILELHPTGTNTANIVWEWHLWDHLVQNQYPTKANYQATIVDHPELLNVNYQNTQTDWVHMNGIDYNPDLDQIVVSSHFLNELFVIDHSTTTAEAASHSGGTSGKGGDFLYRWGNPASYGATGTKIFKVVHDAHWVPSDCPRAGWLVGFNNQGVSSNASAIDMFEPTWNGTEYAHTPGQAYEPATYGYRHAAAGYSSNMGNSQQLPNGNMLVCLATASKVYEIDANGNQLWQYTSTGSIPQAWRFTRCYLENPTVNVLTAAPQVCVGGTTQLDITPSATNVSNFTYSWSPTAGLSDATIQDPKVSGLPQSATYTVTISTPGGCSVTATIPVTVVASNFADAGPDQDILIGTSTTLHATGGISYSWSNGQEGPSIMVHPLVTTVYSVTVTTSDGCVDVDEVEVAVHGTTLQSTLSVSDTVICKGESVAMKLSVAGGSGQYTINWQINGVSQPPIDTQFTVTPTSPTLYLVTVSDGVNTQTHSVFIQVNNTPVANAGADILLPFGNNASLNATGGGQYLWSTGETTANISVSPTLTTTYSVTVSNAEGCTDSDEITVTITGSALSVLASAFDNAFCLGEGTDLSATASGGSGQYTYQWRVNGQLFSTLQNPHFTPAASATVTVVVSDGTSSVQHDLFIEVYPLPVVNAGLDQDITYGQSAQLTAEGALQYLWNTGQTTASIQVTPQQSTLYSVSGEDANGCRNTDSVWVQVTGFPPINASISASDTVICTGDIIQLLAQATGGSGSYTYSWTSEPVGFTSSLPNPFINPEQTTVYTLEVNDGFSTQVLTFEIVVIPLPAQPVITSNGATLVSSAGSNNQWFYYGNPILDATGQEYSPIQEGSYQVQTVDANGCFSPLSDPFEFLISGVNDLLSNTIRIAPNPAATTVKILGDWDPQSSRVEIWNSAGQCVLTLENSAEVNVSQLPSGAYCLRLQQADQLIQRVLIIHR